MANGANKYLSVMFTQYAGIEEANRVLETSVSAGACAEAAHQVFGLLCVSVQAFNATAMPKLRRLRPPSEALQVLDRATLAALGQKLEDELSKMDEPRPVWPPPGASTELTSFYEDVCTTFLRPDKLTIDTLQVTKDVRSLQKNVCALAEKTVRQLDEDDDVDTLRQLARNRVPGQSSQLERMERAIVFAAAVIGVLSGPEILNGLGEQSIIFAEHVYDLLVVIGRALQWTLKETPTLVISAGRSIADTFGDRI